MKTNQIEMCLVSGCGISSMVKMGDIETMKYWIDRIIEKGGIPEFKYLGTGTEL